MKEKKSHKHTYTRAVKQTNEYTWVFVCGKWAREKNNKAYNFESQWHMESHRRIRCFVAAAVAVAGWLWFFSSLFCKMNKYRALQQCSILQLTDIWLVCTYATKLLYIELFLLWSYYIFFTTFCLKKWNEKIVCTNILAHTHTHKPW